MLAHTTSPDKASLQKGCSCNGVEDCASPDTRLGHDLWSARRRPISSNHDIARFRRRHRNAAILAAHGFLAFPFGYSNGGNAWNAGNIIDVPLDRTVEAIAALRAFPCSSKKIGLYGISRGAEHALLLASLMARDSVDGMPDAIAAHSPPDVICGASDSRNWRDVGDPGWQSWDGGKRAWSWRGSTNELLPTTPIEIERYNGPLFLSHGTVDKVWSVEMTHRLADRLHQNGKTPEVYFYEGQDHLPGSAAENDHHEHLIAFFESHLSVENALD